MYACNQILEVLKYKHLQQHNIPKHQIQTHKKLKRMLFIRTKHNMRILGVIPLTKLENDTIIPLTKLENDT